MGAYFPSLRVKKQAAFFQKVPTGNAAEQARSVLPFQ
jgi:hypothetical protein